ncbi:hypothetical protein D3C75_937870 [compost metagenome]
MLSGDVSSLLADDALLEPEHTRADICSFPGNVRAVFTAAEHIYNIHWFRDFRQRMITFLAQNLTVHGGVDRNNTITAALHGACHHIRGAVRFVGESNYSYIACSSKNFTNLLPARVLKAHVYFPFPFIVPMVPIGTWTLYHTAHSYLQIHHTAQREKFQIYVFI